MLVALLVAPLVGPVAQAAAAQQAVQVTNSAVEQFDNLWFNLSDFTEGAKVRVELAKGVGDPVVSASFTIGADGNTANPDGQTYRRVTLPRDVAPGSDYVLRVVDAGTGGVLATSAAVTVTPLTTRVYNPGDHAGGEEDVLVQRGGVWTFRASGFAPGGKLTASAVLDGNAVVLSGIGQISSSEKAWQLDANGDVSRAEYARVQIPADVEPGDFEVTLTDGTKTVERTLTVEEPVESAVTVAPSVELGGTLKVTGVGFTHPVNGGSKIAIKIDDGAYSRVDASLHQNQTIWWIVQADENGSFEIDMPVPNGTTADSSGTLGSMPALTPGEGYTLRFLTGNLDGGPSRTMKSSPFTVTGSVDPVDPKPEVKNLTTKTPKITGSAKVGKTLKVDSKSVAWTPAKVTLKYQWLRDGKSISGATKSSYKVTKSDAGKKLSVKVTGSKSGYKTVSKTSKTVSVAKVASSVKVSVPSLVAKGKQATIKVSISAATSKPTGTVTVKVNGKTVKKTVSSSAKGKVSVKLPKISKKGSYKVSVSFKPSGSTAKSTAASKSVTKTLKVSNSTRLK
ncbi:Ig-like domain repeat protein [Tessaracoccus caeni]|uniref:Ig-like domain repeat protein n=1 Tax=Tessaracoccus caeni TaxID=3031239 RepID=UPI0023D9CFB1|nr:Ig-like domain repeat protein [Tessaracoccus caeni]MDF1487427.1 Ig-like domain repeat protein [Tessaracoccus caeni]